MQLDKKRIWITGASTGIGRATAIELSSRGARVALSARTEEKLHEVAEECPGPDVLVQPLDVTELDRNHGVVESIVDEWGGLDVAFLNAGRYDRQGKDPLRVESFKNNYEVNFFGIVHGIKAALPHLDESDQGLLVGMSSATAYGPLPLASSYGSSKAAVKYMLESLRFEWGFKDVDVDISVVCPGFVESPMTSDNEFQMPFLVETDRAGNIIADGIKKRKREIHFPWQLTYTLKLVSKLPGILYDWIVSKLNTMQ